VHIGILAGCAASNKTFSSLRALVDLHEYQGMTNTPLLILWGSQTGNAQVSYLTPSCLLSCACFSKGPLKIISTWLCRI